MNTVLSIIKMIFFLGIILYLISLAMKFLNRYTTQQHSDFQVVKKIATTKNSAIGIVKIIDTFYVMSFSEQQNTILRELTVTEAKNLEENLATYTAQKNEELEKLVFIAKERFKKGFKKS
ncbi:flagellar biosynthetic protein FliO [Enterococcus bulliens]